MSPAPGRRWVWALLAVAAGVFVLRGPLRAWRYREAWVDFAVPYVEARCWLQGLNPYDEALHRAEWHRTGGYGLETLGGRGAAATPYFPAALPLIAPFALLPWSGAREAWIAVSCVLLAALAVCAGRMRASATIDQQLLISALLLLAPPTHTLLWTGNLTLASVAAGVAGHYWAEIRSRPVLAGFLIALSVAAKPQIGAWVLLFELLSRRWRPIASAVVCLASLTAVFAFWLLVHGADWLGAYLTMSHAYLGPGLATDFAGIDPRRFNLLNVQVIFAGFTGNRTAAGLLGWLLVLALLAVWSRGFFRARTAGERLLAFGTLLTLSLLPVYHRIYDAIVLVIPAVWVLAPAPAAGRRLTAAVRVLLALFLLPTGSILVAAAVVGGIPPALADAWWWNAFVMPHQNWVLLGLAAGLLLALTRLTRAAPAAPRVS